MSIWLVETFGSQQLNHAFWMINGIVTPFWVLMIFLPDKNWVRTVCHPFFGPALMGGLHLYMIYILITTTGIPPLPGFEVRALRTFVNHPIVFLVVWTHYMSADLFLGAVLFQDSCRRRMRVPVELFLCWFLGPVGLCVYLARLCVRTLTLRTA